MRILILFAGKPRDRHANAMAEEYLRRSQRWARSEMREIRAGTEDPWRRHPTAKKILLDPAGRAADSAFFGRLLATAEREARDLVFLVGDAEGAPPEWKTGADLLVSLSPLTLPHELARVVLAEQIYRALATLRGHPYPR